jgi:hypothetical protein
MGNICHSFSPSVLLYLGMRNSAFSSFACYVSSLPGLKGMSLLVFCVKEGFLAVLLNGDLPGCSINGDAASGGDAFGGSRDSDDRRDAILTGHDRTVRNGPAHLHDQPASREEEGRPAGIGGWRDQDVTGGQMGTCGSRITRALAVTIPGEAGVPRSTP